MAVNNPNWSYGENKVFNSSGTTTTPDSAWSYGESKLLHEYVAAGGWTGKVMGVTNPSKINGISVANISKVNGI